VFPGTLRSLATSATQPCDIGYAVNRHLLNHWRGVCWYNISWSSSAQGNRVRGQWTGGFEANPSRLWITILSHLSRAQPMSKYSSLQPRKFALQRLEPRMMLTINPVGTEFRVNDVTPGFQTIGENVSSVAVSEEAGLIAAYTGVGAGRRASIFLRHFDFASVAQGDAVRASATVQGTRTGAVVAANEAGNTVVVWQGRGPGDKYGIFLQRFDKDGEKVGDEQLVNETIGGKQYDPAVGMAADGSFVVSWSGPDATDPAGVFARRFRADGTPLAGEERVNTTVASDQEESEIAVNSRGEYVITWSSRNQDAGGTDTSDWGVFGQRFDSAGTRQGDEFQVNSTTAASQREASVAMQDDGTFLVVWSSLGQDGDSWAVVAQRFDAAGIAQGGEFVVNSSTAGHQRHAQVAGARGKYLVTWQSGVADGSGWEVMTQEYDATGNRLGSEQRVNSLPHSVNSGQQQHPAVALNAAGKGAILWSGYGTTDRQGVFGRSYLDDDAQTEPNLAPDLATISDQTVVPNTQLTVTVTATDPNAADTLTYQLDPTHSPTDATIERTENNTAVIRWTPTDSDAGAIVSFRVLVTDNGEPPLADVEEFQVTVGPTDPDVAADLVGFAQALAASGTEFFGAAWCPSCTAQKEQFEDGGQFLPFIEVTNPDRSLNQVGEDNTIDVFPTWVFPDGTRLEGEQSLATISARSGVAIPVSKNPFLAPITVDTLLVGSPLHVSLDGYDPNGGPLTYSASTNNPAVTAEILSGNRSARIDVAGFGDMVFELFEQRASRPTDRFIELANDDFYDGIIFHRVIDDFVIQGGDPLGTGTGGSTLGDFDDQFHVDLQHNRTGLLSYAKSSDDTNDSQFFVTEFTDANSMQSLRNLDFNHSIFGVLVEGEANRAAISDTAVSGSKPTFDVVMEDVVIFQDDENGVLFLKADPGTSGVVTVTVTVAAQQGNTFERIFDVTLETDFSNGRPFLADIGPVSIATNTSAEIQLIATDVEGDSFVFTAVQRGSVDYTFDVRDSGLLTVSPPTDFVGTLQIEARVGRASTSSDFDSQLITIEVLA